MRPYRQERIASTIRTIISEAIAHKLNDPRIVPLTTITRVEVARDLMTAKVFVSVMGTEAEERLSFRAIEHAAAHIQRIVADQLSIRQCPQLVFKIDESVKMARKTLAILEANKRENPSLSEPLTEDETDAASSDESQANLNDSGLDDVATEDPRP